LLADEILIDEVNTDNENSSICENINVLKNCPIKSNDQLQNSDINLIEIDLRNKIKEVFLKQFFIVSFKLLFSSSWKIKIKN
jgi:hypothetical protein